MPADWSIASPGFWAAALAIANVVICAIALGVVPGGRKPSTAMAWLILVLAVPFLGVLAFLLFGSTTVGPKRRARQEQVNAAILDGALVGSVPAARPDTLPEPIRGLVRLNHHLGMLPMTDGNTVELLEEYEGAIRAMCLEVAAAREYVHVQFYISAWDEMTAPFFEELVRATERGVTVRFLFDHLGSRGIPGYRDLVTRLRGTRIQWATMLPIHPLAGQLRRPDLRNHRKILVVDGRVAFSGSQNLIEPCYDKPKNQKLGRAWVELVARLEGPAVTQLDAVFATDWYTETAENLHGLVDRVAPPGSPRPGAVTDVGCQVVPSGPGFVTENNLRLFNGLLYSANRRVWMASPYFVPDESLLYAVTTAAQRGVDVQLFVSEVADQFMVAHAQRSYYDALLTAGVRIWLYPAPFVLHAKHFCIDDEVAVIGSSNMDMRSFALNYEVVMMMTGAHLVRRLAAVQDGYRELSTELTLDAWRSRSRGAAYVDNVMRLTAALQ